MNPTAQIRLSPPLIFCVLLFAAVQCSIAGDEIRSVRNHWAMPLAEFGEHFGVAASTVCDWERNGVTCRNQKFDRRIYRVLKLSHDVLGEFAEERQS